MPVVVDGSRFVDDGDARPLQPVTEFEILVAVSGKRFVEAADTIEVRAPHRCVAGEEIQPREPLGALAVERHAQRRVGALAFVVGERVDLYLHADHRLGARLAMVLEMAREQVGRRDDICIGEQDDGCARRRDARVARHRATVVGPGQVADVRMVGRDLGEVLRRAVVRARVGDDDLEGVGRLILREQRWNDGA